MGEPAGFPCPCCGYRTLPGRSPTDEICPVCFWQDDFVDNQDTDVLGPNRVTLSVARENYARLGASEERLAGFVRPPRPEEGPPEPWTETRGALRDTRTAGTRCISQESPDGRPATAT